MRRLFYITLYSGVYIGISTTKSSHWKSQYGPEDVRPIENPIKQNLTSVRVRLVERTINHRILLHLHDRLQNTVPSINHSEHFGSDGIHHHVDINHTSDRLSMGPK